MNFKGPLRISLVMIFLLLLFVWRAEIFAQQPRFGMERGGTRDVGPRPDSSTAMAISPDSKYLYLFHATRIYQFKLPELTLAKSIEVEVMGMPEMQGRGERDFIKDFDVDMDGRVSREEFTGPSQLFERFDKNNDGYIDTNEAPKQH